MHVLQEALNGQFITFLFTMESEMDALISKVLLPRHNQHLLEIASLFVKDDFLDRAWGSDIGGLLLCLRIMEGLCQNISAIGPLLAELCGLVLKVMDHAEVRCSENSNYVVPHI